MDSRKLVHMYGYIYIHGSLNITLLTGKIVSRLIYTCNTIYVKATTLIL